MMQDQDSLENIANLLRSQDVSSIRQAEEFVSALPIFIQGEAIEEAKRVFTPSELDWLSIFWHAVNDPKACLGIVEIEIEGFGILPSGLDKYESLERIYPYDGLYDDCEYEDMVVYCPDIAIQMRSNVILSGNDIFQLNEEERTELPDESLCDHITVEWEHVLHNRFANGTVIEQEVIYRVTPRDYWHYSVTYIEENGHFDQNMSFSFQAHLTSREDYEEYVYQLVLKKKIEADLRPRFPHKILECTEYCGLPENLDDELKQCLQRSVTRKESYKTQVLQSITDLEIRLAKMKREWSKW
jgi:hypothetical protein